MIVRSNSDITDTVEVLTDIDVIGIEAIGEGIFRRTIFDCKTGNKMSSINRAFWCSGLKDYTSCDDAYVILKNKAVQNHRLSALRMSVDLHDEDSFKDLGRTLDPSFPADDCYQAKLERWNAVFDAYVKNAWSEPLFDLARNGAPLTRQPWSVFRKILAEFRAVRGHIDPDKTEHIAIFFDILTSAFVLWAAMSRDIRRFYEPTMGKSAFENVLRYYLWGGKEAYNIRQQLREKTGGDTVTVDLPAWDVLVAFGGLLVSAPQNVLECAYICRELSLRALAGKDVEFDARLAGRLKNNTRIRQFTSGLSEYFVAAAGLPKDMQQEINEILFEI